MKKIYLIMMLLLLSGCYNYRESDTVAFVSAIAIDYQDQNYELTIEIKENQDKATTSSFLLTSKAPKIEEALDKLLLTHDKPLYFGIIDILLLTPESLLKTDEITEHIKTTYDFAFNFNVAISDEPLKVIKFVQRKEEVFGIYIKTILKNNHYLDVTYPDFLKNTLKGETINLPVLKLDGEELLFRRSNGTTN